TLRRLSPTRSSTPSASACGRRRSRAVVSLRPWPSAQAAAPARTAQKVNACSSLTATLPGGRHLGLLASELKLSITGLDHDSVAVGELAPQQPHRQRLDQLLLDHPL